MLRTKATMSACGLVRAAYGKTPVIARVEEYATGASAVELAALLNEVVCLVEVIEDAVGSAWAALLRRREKDEAAAVEKGLGKLIAAVPVLAETERRLVLMREPDEVGGRCTDELWRAAGRAQHSVRVIDPRRLDAEVQAMTLSEMWLWLRWARFSCVAAEAIARGIRKQVEWRDAKTAYALGTAMDYLEDARRLLAR